MRAIIVDDEPKAIKSLESMLELFTTDTEVVKTAQSKAEAIEVIKEYSPDIVFLDIELQDGSGLEVLESFKERSFITVFVTAYDRYVLEALRAQAFDYILKPIDPDDLERIVDKAIDCLSETSALKKYNKLCVRSKGGFEFISLNEIIRIESDNNYTSIKLKNGENVLVSKTLKSFEIALTDTHFIRVHQSHMVNHKEIKNYVKSKNSQLILRNGESIPLSRGNRGAIDKLIEDNMIVLE